MNKVKKHFNKMTTLIDNTDEDDFGSIWDEFWTLSQKVSKHVHIDYYDPDTTCFEDIMARYEAIQSYLED